MNKLNAGDRLLRVMQYLGIENQTELSELLGKSQSRVSEYLAQPKFSDAVLRTLSVLEKKGINTLYFSEPDEPMLLKEVVKRELLYDDYLKLRSEVARQAQQIKQDANFKAKVLSALDSIENKLKDL
jgi:hypothetical protein